MKLILLALTLIFTSNCFSQDFSVPDSIAIVQGCNGFCAINDGHPGPPNLPFFQNVTSIDGDFILQNSLCLSSTMGNGFFRNSLFSLNVFTADWDEKLIIEESLTTSWQHRWVYEQRGLPTITTLLSTTLPYNDRDLKPEYQGVMIINKSIGTKGTLYFNSFFDLADNDLTYTALIGHKTILTVNTNLFIDILYEFENSSPIIELAYEYNLDSGSVISPGVQYEYDTKIEKGSFVFGLSLLHQTN